MTKDIRIFTRPSSGNPTIQFSGSAYSSMQLEVHESGSIAFMSSSESLFTILDNGNVGIGVTDPDTLLELYKVGTQLKLSGGAADYATFAVAADGALTITTVDDTAALGHIALMPDGNVGIGTTSPATKLEVKGVSTSRNTIVNEVTINGGTSSENPYSGFGFGINLIGRDYGNAVRNYASISTIMEGNLAWSGGADAAFKSGLAFNINKGGAVDTNPTEVMRINSAGNVGIGTSSPLTKLHIVEDDVAFTPDANYDHLIVEDVTGAVLQLVSGTSGISEIGFSDTARNPGLISYTHSDNKMRFRTAGVFHMAIDSAGNVGIGTTSPADALHVVSAVTTTHRGNLRLDDSSSIAAGTGGQITFGGIYSGSDYTEWAGIQGTKAVATSGNYGGELEFRTRTHGSAMDTKMIIDTDGNVGIGTTSPSKRLHVYGTSADTSSLILDRYESGASRTLTFTPASSDTTPSIIDSSSGYGMRIDVGGTETMFFKSDGNVGIGTTSPGAKLEVRDNVDGYAMKIYNDYFDGDGLYIYSQDTGADNTEYMLLTENAGGNVFAVKGNGNVGIGTTSPSQKLHVQDGNIQISNSNTYLIINRTSTGTKASVEYQTAGTPNWYTGIADSGNAGDGSEFYIGQSDGGTSADLWIETNGNVGIGTTSPGHTLTLKDSGSLGSSTFISGITGTGYKVTDAGAASNGVSLEIDNITVRNTLRTHIFQKDVVKATNGIVFVSDSGVIADATSGSAVSTVSFRTDKSATFTDGTQMWYKDADSNTGTINSVKFTINGEVTSSGGIDEYNVTYNSGTWSNIATGSTAVRMSGGTLVLDASSANSPYMDVNESSGSVVVRTGNLDGVVSPTFGQLAGYGLWASGSTYLEGTINATQGGIIGGWLIGKTMISSSNSQVQIDSGNSRFLIADSSGNEMVRMGLLNGSAEYGISGSNAAGELLFKLGEAGNEIAGWTIDTGKLAKGPVSMSYDETAFIINNGDVANKVRMGSLDGKFGLSGGEYGFILGTGGSDSSADDVLVELSDNRNMIAGWDLIPGTILSNNAIGSVALSAYSQSLTIWTGSVDYAEPKLVLGKLPLHDGTIDQPYGFAVFSGTGTVSGSQASASILITANKARLAGWELSPGRLSSGTVADINGNNASIALGTGATTATGTPTDGLFFVSASASPVFYVGSTFSYVNDVLTAGGWKIGKGQISSSSGEAILSGSGVLSLGSGTHEYTASNRTYIDGPNNRMSIGTGFYYESDALVINGNATIAGWTINSATIVGGNVTLGSSGYVKVGSVADATTTATTNSGFYADNSGNVLIKGNVSGNDYLKVTGGGSIDIKATTFEMSSSGIVMDSAANRILVGSGNATAVIDGDEGIWAGNKAFASAPFSVDTAGGLTASNANISGDITATNANISGSIYASYINASTAGIIGGFTLDSVGIYSADKSLMLSGSGQITGSTVLFTGGKIGGWTIDATTLANSTDIVLDAANTKLYLANKSTFSAAVDGVYIGTDGISIGDADEFNVTNAGVLSATGATIAGNITATSGQIANFTLDNYSLWANIGGVNKPTSSNLQLYSIKTNPYIALRSFKGMTAGKIIAGRDMITDATNPDDVIFTGERILLDGETTQLNYYTSSDATPIVTVGADLYGASTVPGIIVQSGSIVVSNDAPLVAIYPGITVQLTNQASGVGLRGIRSSIADVLDKNTSSGQIAFLGSVYRDTGNTQAMIGTYGIADSEDDVITDLYSGYFEGMNFRLENSKGGTTQITASIHLSGSFNSLNKFDFRNTINSASIQLTNPDTSISAGQVLGEIVFRGLDSDIHQPDGAYIKAEADTNFTVAGAIDGKGTHLKFYTAPTALVDPWLPTVKMTIEANGNVGIGTTTPLVSLDLGISTDITGADQVFGLRTNANSRFGLGTSDQNMMLYVPSDITSTSGFVFGTISTADGSTFSEKVRIDRTGNIGIGTTNPSSILHTWEADNVVNVKIDARNASFTSDVLEIDVNRATSTKFDFAEFDSTTGTVFRFAGNGTGYADVAWTGPAADYAEYFETLSGDTIPYGTTVVLVDEKIRLARINETPIGVIRPPEAPGFVGNDPWNHWKSKYLKDDFGGYLYENYSIVGWPDISGSIVSYEVDKIPDDIVIPEGAISSSVDSDGSVLQRRILNPRFDKKLKYIPRPKRKEWCLVGLMGQMPVLKDQPMSSNWVRMKSISRTVDLYLVK